MFEKVLNIGANSMRRRNFSVMLNKVALRIKEQKSKESQEDVLDWCKRQAQPYEVFLKDLDEGLWQEAVNACRSIEQEAQKKLSVLGLDLGGGGHYPILYFFTRYLNALCVVETGVAAGWSSQAILTAIQKNGGAGHLYSSDFPYFRYKNPEKLVGYIVDDTLKGMWDLYIDGDRNNLPLILQKADRIDLFHYDSDKSYDGRTYALDIIKPKLTPESVIIFDDIQDNSHFKDFVESAGVPYRIFEFEGKYLGLTSPFLEKMK